MRWLSQLIREILHEESALWFLLLSFVFDHAVTKLNDNSLIISGWHTHRASTLRSSPSTPNTGFGVFASMTYSTDDSQPTPKTADPHRRT